MKKLLKPPVAYIRKLAGIALCCFFIHDAAAQLNDVLKLPGKKEDYYGKEGGPNTLNNDALDAATLNTLRSKLLAIANLVESCPGFASPRGFNLRVQLSPHKPSPYCHPLQHALVGMSWLAMHEFYRDENGKVQEDPETRSGITVRINNLLDLFPDQFNMDCDEFALPRFFTNKGFEIKDSSLQYLRLGDGRQVFTNGHPLVIPFTKEQYLTFRLKQKQKELGERKDAFNGAIKLKESAATAPDGHKVTAADRNNEKYNYLLVLLENSDQNIDIQRKALGRVQSEFDQLNNQLKTMPPAEKRSQAHIYYHILGETDPVAVARFLQLADDNDPKGDVLVMPNPAYYNKTIPLTGIQLITVEKNLDLGFSNNPYEEIVDGVLRCIDYKALKNMIQY